MSDTEYEPTRSSGRHDYSQEQALAWGVRQLQADFARQPPKVQRETRERVQGILAAERASGRVQPSPLAKIARAVYGVRP